MTCSISQAKAYFNISQNSLQVADLRKKLKAFGLPVTGNKTELMERLQEACASNKGNKT